MKIHQRKKKIVIMKLIIQIKKQLLKLKKKKV